MKYTRASIYSYVRGKILSAFSTAYVSAKYEPIPQSMPAVFIEQVNKVRTQSNIDLGYSDGQYVSMFEAQVFSNSKNGALAEAEAIMKIIEGAFNDLFFYENYCAPVYNVDNTVYRLTARFTKQIAEGDEITA